MRAPISWLKEFAEVPVSAEELAHRLTMAGIEVSGLEYIGLPPPEGAGTGLHKRWAAQAPIRTAGVVWDRDKMIVGEIRDVQPHPNADRLAVATVDWGAGPVQSVHGAPNLPVGSTGQKVAVALPGAQIADAYGEDRAHVEVKRIKLRGVESRAVICSERELGLSEDHSGVLLLEDDAPVGMPLAEYMGDVVLEFDLTPDLGRCLSIVGVAREAAALAEGALHLMDPQWQAWGEAIEEQAEVTIEDPELCPRYTAALIRDIAEQKTPFWMRRRLLASGVRPISMLVDITNYVMLEWGQPLHAFDHERLRKRASGGVPKIVIRRARPGERLTTLDGVARELQPDMLLITDERGPIAIAGVMGGRETEVSESTRHVLLESANFQPINNRRTARTLQIPSEASRRFSRGVPPHLAEKASVRAAELMRTIGGGTIARGLVDAYPRKPKPTVIELDPKDVERLLGMVVETSQIVEILERLDFTCRESDGTIEVSVPYHRLDVEIPADLVEEVARVAGYDRLPSDRLSDTLPPQRPNRSLAWEERVRDLLTACGLTEAINYSLTSPERVARLYAHGEPPDDPYVELANPISSERTHLRRMLVDGLLDTVAANLRHRERVNLFEVGRVFLPDPDQELPEEPRRVAIALAGARRPPSWSEERTHVDFYDLKGIAETLLQDLRIEGAQFVPDPANSGNAKAACTLPAAMLHPGRSAALRVEDEILGMLGEIHPKVAQNFGLERRGGGAERVYVAELDLEGLLERAQDLCGYRPLPRYPGVYLDLAVLVDGDLPAERVEKLIHEHGGELLQDVRLFDVYRGERIAEGKKSLAYSLLYRAEDRTLTDEEALDVHGRIQEALERELGAQVRGLED